MSYLPARKEHYLRVETPLLAQPKTHAHLVTLTLPDTAVRHYTQRRSHCLKNNKTRDIHILGLHPRHSAQA